jgi:hypothetical protein
VSGLLILLPLMALIPAFIAKHRGQGFWTFYVFGLLLWIVAVPVALFSKDKRRRCPHCVEVIHAQATACPHCQRDVTEHTEIKEPPQVTQIAAPQVVTASPPEPPEPTPMPSSAAAQPAPSLVEASEKRKPRNKRKVWIGAIALAILALVVGIAVSSHKGNTSGAGSNDSAAAATSNPTSAAHKSCSSYKGAKPRGCLSKTGFACASYGSAKPNDCFSAAQLRSRAAAKLARARAAARARAQAVAAAKAQAAADAAANAWHRGYNQQDENVYWKWVKGNSCAAYTSNGCWHVEVITRDGCASYVAVNANEYANGQIINSLLDNQGYGIPAQTPRLFELDADQNGVTAADVKIDCV